ncbi:hypothetical protein [Lysobacter brunescens]|uniref:Uncharacterized protein n=1 Tax=Lysobacter brunescens TaxID=262323 RepID=A0ABW2Y815_9GAMM
MKHRLTTGLVATIFAIGLALAPLAHARDIVSDDVVGMVCDESTAGTIADDGYNVYYCDGRNWIRTGSI